MNSGIVEQGGETARSAVSALAGTPVMLALVILQIFTLGGISYSIYNRQNATNTIIHKLIDLCGSKQSTKTLPMSRPRLRPMDNPPKPQHSETDPPKPPVQPGPT